MSEASRPVIEVEHLGKTYRIYGNPYHRLLERMPWQRRPLHREVRALHDVTFVLQRGECMGLVGNNGAGKSTLLKILSGTTFPTEGRYSVNGRATSLLELGAGFHYAFSGRENILMNAALMGMPRREALGKLQQIIEFSELGAFIDAPLRTYSSGMAARLGFAAAVAMDPDLLIIDEVFAVGDMNFRRKCIDRIFDFKRRGKAMLFCSHSLYDVRQLCERAIWMRGGSIQQLGDAITTTNNYSTWETEQRDGDPLPYRIVASAGGEVEDHPVVQEAVLVDPATGEPRHTYSPGDGVAVRVHVRNPRRVRLVVAVGVVRTDGTLCFASTTQFAGLPFDFAEGHVTLMVTGLRLLSGEFTVPVWLLDENGVHRYVERPARQKLVVTHGTKDIGLFLQECTWQLRPLAP